MAGKRKNAPGGQGKAAPKVAKPPGGKKATHRRHIELTSIIKASNEEMSNIKAEITSDDAMHAVVSDFAAAKARAREAAAAAAAAARAALASAEAVMDSVATLRGALEAQAKALQASSGQTDGGLDRTASKMLGAVFKFWEGLKPKKKGLKKAALGKNTVKEGAVVKVKGKRVAFRTA